MYVDEIEINKFDDNHYYVRLNDYYPIEFRDMPIEEVASFINVLAMVKKEDLDIDSIIKNLRDL